MTRQAQRGPKDKGDEIALVTLEMSCAPEPGRRERMRTPATWKVLAYRVPPKAKPADVEWYTVPGYRCVERERHRFRRAQV
ncbi:MAG: hypothetical protein WCE63_05015 [Acidobacteriaceae bacterium]